MQDCRMKRCSNLNLPGFIRAIGHEPSNQLKRISSRFIWSMPGTMFHLSCWHWLLNTPSPAKVIHTLQSLHVGRFWTATSPRLCSQIVGFAKWFFRSWNQNGVLHPLPRANWGIMEAIHSQTPGLSSSTMEAVWHKNVICASSLANSKNTQHCAPNVLIANSPGYFWAKCHIPLTQKTRTTCKDFRRCKSCLRIWPNLPHWAQILWKHYMASAKQNLHGLEVASLQTLSLDRFACGLKFAQLGRSSWLGCGAGQVMSKLHGGWRDFSDKAAISFPKDVQMIRCSKPARWLFPNCGLWPWGTMLPSSSGNGFVDTFLYQGKGDKLSR